MAEAHPTVRLDPACSALLLIDLQNAIINLPLVPYDGRAILGTCMELAARFRRAGAPVFLVQAELGGDPALALNQPADEPMAARNGNQPEGFDALADGLQQPGDLIVTKRQWGAFYGTDLDLQLGRRRISTLVIAGIATNFGVESTVRQAWERNYAVVVPEDAMGSFTPELHELAITAIFPRIARVRPAAAIEIGLSHSA